MNALVSSATPKGLEKQEWWSQYSFFGYHFKISSKLNVRDQTGVRGCHKEVGILFSESTKSRDIHECKCRDFTISCRPVITLKIRKIIFSQKTSKKAFAVLQRKKIFRHMKPRLTWTRMMRREKCIKGEKQLIIQRIPNYLSNMVAMLWKGQWNWVISVYW